MTNNNVDPLATLRKAFYDKATKTNAVTIDASEEINLDFLNDLSIEIGDDSTIILMDLAEFEGFKIEEIINKMNTVELPVGWKDNRRGYWDTWLKIIARKGFKPGRKMNNKSNATFVTFYKAFNPTTKNQQIVSDNKEGSKLARDELTPQRLCLALLPRFHIICSMYLDPVVKPTASKIAFGLQSPIFAGLFPKDPKWNKVFELFVTEVCIPFSKKVPKSKKDTGEFVYADEEETRRFAELGRGSSWIREETKENVMKGTGMRTEGTAVFNINQLSIDRKKEFSKLKQDTNNSKKE